MKEEYIKNLLALLWVEKAVDAIQKIGNFQIINQEKADELIAYLQKNQSHIIDYDKRQKAGKLIGSGRMEKTVDCLVAQSQKRKAMS